MLHSKFNQEAQVLNPDSLSTKAILNPLNHDKLSDIYP